MIEQFSQKTQEELKYYVYILIDPRDNKIFYVGKGYGNRVFFHINEVIFNPIGTEKLEIKTYDNKRKKKSENPIYDRPNIYEATRGWWVLDKNRAENSDFVLVEYKGVIRAVFKPEKWVQDIENRGVKRWGFEGSEVTSKEIFDIYMNKEVPKIRGMANPIRYFEKIPANKSK